MVLSVFFISTTHCFGQHRNKQEVRNYLDKHLVPRIDNIPLESHFKDADLVVEGFIVDAKRDKELRQNIYTIKICRIFKGSKKHEVINILVDVPLPPAVNELGAWSLDYDPRVYFLKQEGAVFRFINPSDAWITYPNNINPLRHGAGLSEVLYHKFLEQDNSFCKETDFLKKKEESLREKSVEPEIDSITPSIAPAGLWSGDLSKVVISGSGFGNVKGRVYLRDANIGGIEEEDDDEEDNSDLLRLLRAVHILSWSDTEIQIHVPSIGYQSENEPNGLLKCAGTGPIKVYREDSEGGGSATSSQILTVPYAINNFVVNSGDFFAYDPYELRLHNANNKGGYTFIYDENFYNNADALAAFRRAATTWRCETKVDFREICGTNNLCREEVDNTFIYITFEKDCFELEEDSKALATTRIAGALDPTAPACYAFFTDVTTMVFRENDLVYECVEDGELCPAIWNFSENDNSEENQYNFETVALHELGHILLLKHVVDETSLMYWNIPTGTSELANKKTIDDDSKTGIDYIVNRDIIDYSCGNQPLILLEDDVDCDGLGTGKNESEADESLCFVDLRMRDNNWDSGQEPNYSAGVDADGDGWSIDSPADWEDIWDSPDLWTCPDNDDCSSEAGSSPVATVPNNIGFTIYNAHPNLVSDPVELHIYYTMASMGENWESEWVDNSFWANPTTSCLLGDEIADSPVIIPAIDPQTTYTDWADWSPPNFVNDDYAFYADPSLCGLTPETDPADGELKYEICLLARLISEADPIVGESSNVPIRDNVLNSNNIVTKNMFLIDPAFAGLGNPIPGRPSVILVANNNDHVKNLDIVFDKISAGSTATLNNVLEVSFVLSPELWAKWESTGKESEGIEIIDEREVKVTNLEIAKLLNLPFDAREFQPFAIKVTIITNTGKTVQNTFSSLPEDFGFRITHRSSDGSPINKPSNCLFKLENVSETYDLAQNLLQQMQIFPNPFQNTSDISFYLSETENITINLYDLQGRLVKTVLANENLSAGKHRIVLEADNLKNGVYLCVLNGTKTHFSQKIVKMK